MAEVALYRRVCIRAEKFISANSCCLIHDITPRHIFSESQRAREGKEIDNNALWLSDSLPLIMHILPCFSQPLGAGGAAAVT